MLLMITLWHWDSATVRFITEGEIKNTLSLARRGTSVCSHWSEGTRTVNSE